METNRLTRRQRATLVVSALATLLVMAMAQCASLSVDNNVRAALTLTAIGLSVLCVSILLEDIVVRPVLHRLRALSRRHALLTK